MSGYRIYDLLASLPPEPARSRLASQVVKGAVKALGLAWLRPLQQSPRLGSDPAGFVLVAQVAQPAQCSIEQPH